MGILMQPSFITRRRFGALMILHGAFLLPRSAAASEPLAVVVGPGSKLTDISSGLLRRVFLNRPTPSPDGDRFIPLNHRLSLPARVHFDRAVLGLEPDEVQRYWVDQKIRGIKPPRTVPVEAVEQVLEQLPGTICYLPVRDTGKLRVVTIDGHGPKSARYPLT